MKLKGIELNGNYKTIYRDNCFEIYDTNNNEIYFETNNGYWVKSEYDNNHNEIYCEYSDGDWVKREYDTNNNIIYCEDNSGYIEDNRPQKNIKLTIEELEEKSEDKGE